MRKSNKKVKQMMCDVLESNHSYKGECFFKFIGNKLHTSFCGIFWGYAYFWVVSIKASEVK